MFHSWKSFSEIYDVYSLPDFDKLVLYQSYLLINYS